MFETEGESTLAAPGHAVFSLVNDGLIDAELMRESALLERELQRAGG